LINLSKDYLNQVEYLIGQSIQGNHVLFDLETVRGIFWKEGIVQRSRFTEEDAYSVEHHLEKLILQPTLIEKRAYLEQLDRDTFEKVVKTYFNIVENNLFENVEIHH
jgi:hypothetical protein